MSARIYSKYIAIKCIIFIKELKGNAKDETSPVIIVLLDAKLAFDVVDPYHLLRRLYQTGISDKLWSLINSLHQGATSVVK